MDGVAKAAPCNQAFLVQKDCIQAVISQPFHSPPRFLQELFSLVSGAPMEIGTFGGAGSFTAACTRGWKSLRMNPGDCCSSEPSCHVTRCSGPGAARGGSSCIR